MSDHSERFNALPIDDRMMLNGLMLEAEIRFIELEKKRMLADYRKSVSAINARLTNMKRFLKDMPK